MARTLKRLLPILSVALLLTALPQPGHAAPRPQTDAPVHQVQAGETLSEIAQAYGITLERLMLYNGIENADTVLAGQILALPPEAVTAPSVTDIPATPTPLPETPAEEVAPVTANTDASAPTATLPAATVPTTTSLNQRVNVQLGDTLALIAARTGVDAGALAALNGGIDDTQLRAGQELILPATAADLRVKTPASQVMVAPGDSLSLIAARHGVSLPELMRANALANPDDLTAGQTLVIPPALVSTDFLTTTAVGPARRGFYGYTVRPGDTLSEIAKAFDTPMLAILEYNDLPDEQTVYAGLELRIPFGAPPLPMDAPPIPHSGTSFLVSLSRQQCWLFHGDTVVRTWHCSTGYGEWITRTGSFAVQTKLEMAKSGAYRLDMPYWLGIYDVGDYENGIHGIPISWDTNEKLWDGLIGQPATFGCAMLGDEDAAELFATAYLGMPVHIIP